MDGNIVTQSSTKTKKSLRQALRKILFGGRRNVHDDIANTIGSGILRRDPSLCAIPTPRTTSVSWVDERFDIDDGSTILDRFGSTTLIDSFDVSSLASVVSLGHSLKPQLSLSSFSTYIAPRVEQPFNFSQTVPYCHPQLRSAAPIYHGEPAQTTLRKSKSTLRIQRSDQSLRKASTPASQSRPRSLMRKKSSIADVALGQGNTQKPHDRSPQSKSTTSSVRFAELPPPSRTPSLQSDTSSNSNQNQAICHFQSFCILDTARPQCPVSATSKDLRYIFEIGEEFCLNNRGCEGSSMDMVTGWDASGNPVTHLVLFSPLVITSSGRSRFMLASLVDVTDFINDTASLPELGTISEESFEEDIDIDVHIRTPPPTMMIETPSKSLSCMLSAEDLLGGCFVTDSEPQTPFTQMNLNEDIWVNIATEEKKRSTGQRTPSIGSSMSSMIDDVLHEFMSNLQELYSDFFMLAKSPFDDDYYEICNVSPRVYDSRDFINGHLSKTSTRDMEELSARLAYDEPFTMLVRWGHYGVLRQLYCVPLFARVSTTWVCFLVDSSLPALW